MKVDLFTATGEKKGSLELPAAMFEAKPNKGLMHLALVRQLSNRRAPIAHVKHRGEIAGTTKKAYAQKHTGRARRGALRSPIVRGGGKSFGPRNEANFRKDMPKKMRRVALFSILSHKAKEGAIIGLENYPDTVKTKDFAALLRKLPVQFGRRIVIVTPGRHRGIELSSRNVPRVTAIFAQYMNPVDLLAAKHIIFMADAVKTAEETFGTKNVSEKKVPRGPKGPTGPTSEKKPKSSKPKTSTKKSTSATSVASDTSAPSVPSK